jgi:hypothetical protein
MNDVKCADLGSLIITLVKETVEQDGRRGRRRTGW